MYDRCNFYKQYAIVQAQTELFVLNHFCIIYYFVPQYVHKYNIQV